MGGMEDYHEKQTKQTLKWSNQAKLHVILLVLTTNAFTFFLIAGVLTTWPEYMTALSQVNSKNSLLRQLNSTQVQLAHTQDQLSQVQHSLATSNALLETYLTGIAGTERDSVQHMQLPAGADNEGWLNEISGELKQSVGPHKLPLGYNPKMGTDELYLPLGLGCRRLQKDVVDFMTYIVGGECPSDENAAQRLMLKGCEPLPRRRCHPKSPSGYVEPLPHPDALWTTPPDTSVTWDAYTCKNYKCLNNRSKTLGSYDCRDCFDLSGREKRRWLSDTSSIGYSIDAVMGYKEPGTIRIGLDLGGGGGTFAARMKERNVTIITSSMNFDGPFNSFIASRGLIPIHISISHRLPFFDNTLDIVHSMHVLSNWIPDTVLEFTVFDIYRVLRPGGLFWLDHFFCVGDQLNNTYVPMFGRIGFNKLRWNVGRKLDRGIQMGEWYLSALLEKPMT